MNQKRWEKGQRRAQPLPAHFSSITCSSPHGSDKLSWVEIAARVTLPSISSSHLSSKSALHTTIKSWIVLEESRDVETDTDNHGLLLALWCSYGALHCNGAGKDLWQNYPGMPLRRYPGSLFLLEASSLPALALLCSLGHWLKNSCLGVKHVMLFHRWWRELGGKNPQLNPQDAGVSWLEVLLKMLVYTQRDFLNGFNLFPFCFSEKQTWKIRRKETEDGRPPSGRFCGFMTWQKKESLQEAEVETWRERQGTWWSQESCKWGCKKSRSLENSSETRDLHLLHFL